MSEGYHYQVIRNLPGIFIHKGFYKYTSSNPQNNVSIGDFRFLKTKKNILYQSLSVFVS